jgi:hypothetical protein
METLRKLFGSLLAFVYQCFDRVVIQGSVRQGPSAFLSEESDHADSPEFLDIAIPSGRKLRGERRGVPSHRDDPQGIARWYT